MASVPSNSVPILSDYHYILGEISSLEEKRDVALFQFNQVLSYDKKNPYLRLRKAQELFEQGLIDQARIESEQLVKECDKGSPQKIDIYLFLAQIYHSMNWPQKALDQYHQILQIQPQHPEALLQYALLSIEKGVTPAQGILRSLDHLPDFHHYKGDIYLSQGNEQKAIASFKKAFSLDSGHRRAVLRLFQIYEYKDQIHRIIKLIEQSTFQDTYILSLVAQAYLKKGDKVQVLRQIENLLWDHPLVQSFKKEWLLQKI